LRAFSSTTTAGLFVVALALLLSPGARGSTAITTESALSIPVGLKVLSPAGKEIALRSLLRDMTDIEIVASWCEACRDELRTLAAKPYRNAIRVVVVDERESAQVALTLASTAGFARSFMIDQADTRLRDSGTIDQRRTAYFYGAGGAFGRLAENLHISELPAHVIVDGHGVICTLWSGVGTYHDRAAAERCLKRVAHTNLK
jgi:hypothetical protein